MPLADDADSVFSQSRTHSRARIRRKLLEVNPLVCGRCGARMGVIAVIPDARVVDGIGT